MADETVTVYDVEWLFPSGERHYLTFRPDRGDTKEVIGPEQDGFRFTLALSPTLTEEHIIVPAPGGYMKTTAREVSKAELERDAAMDRWTGDVPRAVS